MNAFDRRCSQLHVHVVFFFLEFPLKKLDALQAQIYDPKKHWLAKKNNSFAIEIVLTVFIQNWPYASYPRQASADRGSVRWVMRQILFAWPYGYILVE